MAGHIQNVLRMYPLGILGSHNRIYLKCTQHLITGHIGVTCCLCSQSVHNVPSGYLGPCPQCDHEAVRDSYNALLEGIGGKIDKTREDVKNLVERISIDFTGAIPGAKSPGSRLDLKREDYPNVQFWTLESWLKIRSGVNTTDSDSPILSLFFEDKSGVRFPKAIGDAVHNNISAFWDGMYADGRSEMLRNWNKTSFTKKEEFRTTLEGKYPWLCLCEANWKANHLWINYFRT